VNRKKLRRLYGHCAQSEARRAAPLQHRTGLPQMVPRPSNHRMSNSPRSPHLYYQSLPQTAEAKESQFRPLCAR
jgi:hypothetical protein